MVKLFTLFMMRQIFAMSQKLQLTLVFKLHDLFRVIYGTYHRSKSKNDH